MERYFLVINVNVQYNVNCRFVCYLFDPMLYVSDELPCVVVFLYARFYSKCLTG
jgi:hypothetical protein